jgi:hypothetical protein
VKRPFAVQGPADRLTWGRSFRKSLALTTRVGCLRAVFWALAVRGFSRAHSSAGERSLHTGEVQGSIPCAPTSIVNEIKYFLDWLVAVLAADWRLHAEQSTKWRAVACKIRAVCSLGVLMRFSGTVRIPSPVS